MSAAMQSVVALAVAGWALFLIELAVARLYRKAALQRGDLLAESLTAQEAAARENDRLRKQVASQAMESNRLRRALDRVASTPPRAGVES